MKNIKKILLILIGVLLLNGCTFKNTNEMSIDKDGKMDYSLTITLDKDTLTTLLQSEDENAEVTDEAMLKYMENGVNYPFLEGLEKSTISDDEYIGYKYSYKIDNIDNISDTNTKEVNLNFYSNKEKLKNLKLFKKNENKYSANFIFNLNNETLSTLSDDISTIQDDIATKQDDTNYDLSELNFITEFSVTLPYKALTHNAETMTNNGKTLNWSIDINKNENIKFTFSLLHIELIKQIATIIGSVILLLVLMLIIAKKQKKKNKKIVYIIFTVTVLLSIALILYLYNRPDIKLPTSLVNKELNELDITYENNIITFKFSDLDKSAEELNTMINYTESTDNMYLNIIDKLKKNDKEIKFYDENNTKILETKINQEQAQKLFGNYIDTIEGDTTLKVIFDTTEENEVLSEIDYKINRERVIRERIVATALKEVGKTGHTYWEWYLGHESTFMEYCAAFVSWVGEKHGQIEAGNIPKFAWVTAGVNFYKDKGWFKYNKDYDPKPGDVVFFNWNNANDLIDHVAFVEKYEDGYVYTIEGNVGGNSSMSRAQKATVRKVVQRKYKKNSLHLYGYGVPQY